ncbi:MAG: hypothetical protein R6V06_10940 [Kiritimatiellia bacterium]
MRNPKIIEWEKPLYDLLREVDTQLESEFGDILPKHPSRPEHGTTSNPQNDGLFRVTANFTAGYGSTHGKGYTLDIDFVTLSQVDENRQRTVEKRALSLIQEGLDSRMPDRNLEVKRDGRCWKIVGDLSLK